jgi:hypothetical protein
MNPWECPRCGTIWAWWVQKCTCTRTYTTTASTADVTINFDGTLPSKPLKQLEHQTPFPGECNCCGQHTYLVHVPNEYLPGTTWALCAKCITSQCQPNAWCRWRPPKHAAAKEVSE